MYTTDILEDFSDLLFRCGTEFSSEHILVLPRASAAGRAQVAEYLCGFRKEGSHSSLQANVQRLKDQLPWADI